MLRTRLDAWISRTTTRRSASPRRPPTRRSSRRYRKLARKHHPTSTRATSRPSRKFKEINEAYEVLGDPDKRKKYDELGANWRPTSRRGAGRPAGASAGGGWNVEHRRRRRRRRLPDDDRRRDAGDVRRRRSVLRLLPHVLRRRAGAGRRRRAAGGRGRAPRARKGATSSTRSSSTLEDAYHGATRRLSIKHDGHARTVDVRIPAGVGDGSRVRVAGEGEHGTGGAPVRRSLSARSASRRIRRSSARARISTRASPCR